MKSYARKQLIMILAPIVVLIPIPFLASYKFNPLIIGGYIIFAAIFVFTLYVILPRYM